MVHGKETAHATMVTIIAFAIGTVATVVGRTTTTNIAKIAPAWILT